MPPRNSPPVSIRNTQPGDIAAIIDLSARVYGSPAWDPQQIQSHLSIFPRGQLVAISTPFPPPRGEGPGEGGAHAGHMGGRASRVVGVAHPGAPSPSPSRGEGGDRIIAMAASLIVSWDDYTFDASWRKFTGGGWFTNHDPAGHTLYGAEVMVDPDSQGRGVGKKLYAARRELCRSLGLARIRAGARLPGYRQYADEMSAEEYVLKVIRGELGDPTLSFQLKRGFRVIAVVGGYLPGDAESGGYAAVIEWVNHAVAQPRDYRKRNPKFGKPRPRKHI